MARTGNSTRAPRKTAAQKAAEAAEATTNETTPAEAAESTTTESDTEATPAEATHEVEETSDMSTDTVEAEAVEAPVSDTTESVEATTEATEKPAEAPIDLSAFEASVATAVAEKDNTTATIPEVNVEAVKEQYRNLNGAKAKNAAKKFLNDKLRDAVNSGEMLDGMATMALIDAVGNAGASKTPASERKPADPSAAYVERLTILHLAYSLARADVPEGIDAEEAQGKVGEQVEALTESAESYFAWVKSTAEDKGDAPEASPLVVKAVKAAQGKAASATRTASSTPRQAGGERRNVRTHINQVFADLESGTFLKVAEIANAKTDEYPDGSCSPGAITAALKSDKGVEGFTLSHNDKGVAGATKN